MIFFVLNRKTFFIIQLFLMSTFENTKVLLLLIKNLLIVMNTFPSILSKSLQKESNFQEQIKSLFSETTYSIDYFLNDKQNEMVDITYTDFLPIYIVKKLLSEIFPKTIKLCLHRQYSDLFVSKVLYNEFKKNNVGVIDCINGSIEAKPIREFINDRLEMTSFTSGYPANFSESAN